MNWSCSNEFYQAASGFHLNNSSISYLYVYSDDSQTCFCPTFDSDRSGVQRANLHQNIEAKRIGHLVL